MTEQEPRITSKDCFQLARRHMGGLDFSRKETSQLKNLIIEHGTEQIHGYITGIIAEDQEFGQTLGVTDESQISGRQFIILIQNEILLDSNPDLWDEED